MMLMISRFLRRSLLFIVPSLFFCMIAGCSGSASFSSGGTNTERTEKTGPSSDYADVIAEGRSAATEIMAETGASSISLAFIDGNRSAWTETFGHADKAAMTVPTADSMYPICSMSKMVATIAVMKLVDQGRVSLDAPVTRYLASFSMLSPEHTQITVRMLLNHSSGFPGADYRNAVSSSPLPFSYSAQVLETLGTQRLKHSPGYLSVYCNEGFTLVEQLVSAVTGKSYTQFVQDEIFTPLGMNHSRFPLESFPDNSFAKRHEGSTPLPQLFVNDFGSGGLYSTPTDMARIAMMLIGKGKVDSVRILSEDAVAAMGTDQTLTNFNPVKSYAWSYGLGWDTVCQPGLRAVGVTGWQKTGDYQGLGTVITVLPREGLAVVVMGASGSFTSGKATVIAERILLRALVEKGRIHEMPVPLTPASRPEKTATDELLDAVSGYYACNDALMRVQGQSGSLNLAYYDTTVNGWKDMIDGLKLREDDRFSSDADPSQSSSFVTAEGRQYLVLRSVNGYGHYQDDLIYGQKVSTAGSLPAAWSSRLNKRWLMTNENPENSDRWALPVFRLHTVDQLLFSKTFGIQIVNPFYSDSRAGMMLLIPQSHGKELDDVVIESRGSEEWIRFGSYLYRPQETVATLINGDHTVAIGTEGLSEWRSIDAADIKTLTIAPAASGGSWKIYDGNLRLIEKGEGTKKVTLSGGTYYLLLHNTANVNLA